MVSFPWWDDSRGHFDLGPPTKGVTDNSDPLHTKSLVYEIAYWRWGLDTDTELKRLLGQPPPRSGPLLTSLSSSDIHFLPLFLGK